MYLHDYNSGLSKMCTGSTVAWKHLPTLSASWESSRKANHPLPIHTGRTIPNQSLALNTLTNTSQRRSSFFITHGDSQPSAAHPVQPKLWKHVDGWESGGFIL